MNKETDRKELRKMGKELYSKIEKEPFSVKKLVHMLEYRCVCESLATY